MNNYAIAIITLLGSLCHQTMAATLTGTVVDESDEPIASATVDIATAAPLIGRGIFCPSCYLDCQKRTKTDEKGRFEITNLDPSLQFRVLFAAEGKATQITKLFKPQSGPLNILLAAAPTAPDRQMVKGQVVDDIGNPIEGALLIASGAKTESRRWRGSVNVLPVVSDRNGRFELILPEDYLGIDIEARADGYAGTRTDLISAGEVDARIEIPLGATVSGYISIDDQPAPGTRVAVVQTDRSSNIFFIKAVARTTDAKGRFSISNLPANQDYVVFTPIGEGSTRTGKVIETKHFMAPTDGQEHDLGELKLESGHSLSGKIVQSSGETLPPNIKLTFGRDPAWDLIEVTPEADGSFKISGLPPESYEVRLALKEYEIDHSQLDLQPIRKNTFGLHLTKSRNDLAIPIRPASPSPPKPEELGVDLNSGNQTLSGIVVDPTGRPIPGINVSAKLQNSYRHLSAIQGKSRPWTETDDNGHFQLVDLPNVPIELLVYKRSKHGSLILYPARSWPSMNSTDIRIIYDLDLMR